MINVPLFKKISIGIPALWLCVLALIPFALVFLGGFLRSGEEYFFIFQLTSTNYAKLFHLIYLRIFLRSFYLASVTAMLCLFLAYPFVYIMIKFTLRVRTAMIFFLVIPFWTSSLIRIYSLIIIIRSQGLLNKLLLYSGLIQGPLEIMFTQTAVLIGLVYSMLPFMILPLYANLEKLDLRLVEAARDLGASKFRALYKVVIPITMPGIIAGIILVLLPAMTLFYIPDILGGAKSMLLGNLIKSQFVEVRDWPAGCAVSTLLTAFMALLLLAYWKMTTSKERQDLL